MITSENIKSVNERVKKVEIKGKNYVCVAARVAAFREICPEGSITTDIIEMKDGIVTMKTTVADETGRVLATGMAHEKESSSYINKTSYIENCETSSVGRALGMLGIGSDEQISSAEEVANAINNQQKNEDSKKKPEQKPKPNAMSDEISDLERDTLATMCRNVGRDPAVYLRQANWPHVSKANYGRALQALKQEEMKNATEGKVN